VSFFIAEFLSNVEPDHYITAAANVMTLYWVHCIFYYQCSLTYVW